MASVREWTRRLWGTLRKNPRDREMEEELRSHLELASEDMLRHGSSTEDALRTATLDECSCGRACIGETTDVGTSVFESRRINELDDERVSSVNAGSCHRPGASISEGRRN